MKTFTKFIFYLLLMMATYTLNAQESNTTTKELPTPEQIKAEFNITDITTASLEQLESAFAKTVSILATIPLEDKEKRKPLVLFKGSLYRQIDMIKTIQAEKEKSNQQIAQLKNENEAKKQIDQQLDKANDALVETINNKKQKIEALKKEEEALKWANEQIGSGN